MPEPGTIAGLRRLDQLWAYAYNKPTAEEMPRPPNCRRVAAAPGACVFKPAGVPAYRLQWLNLTLDEFEALRLADLNGLHQERAAARMRVSRQTFGRIVENARRKVAQALSSGMALNIEGGVVSTAAVTRRDADIQWWSQGGAGHEGQKTRSRSRSGTRQHLD
jgi:predicted DNA-binding protein (UPF0251 family)